MTRMRPAFFRSEKLELTQSKLGPTMETVGQLSMKNRLRDSYFSIAIMVKGNPFSDPSNLGGFNILSIEGLKTPGQPYVTV